MKSQQVPIYCADLDEVGQWSIPPAQEPCNRPRTAGANSLELPFNICICIYLYLYIYLYIHTIFLTWFLILQIRCTSLSYLYIQYLYIFIYACTHFLYTSIIVIYIQCAVLSQCQGFAAVHVVDWSWAQPGRGVCFFCFFRRGIQKELGF